ncbi:TcpD, partial [Clostridium perfringens]
MKNFKNLKEKVAEKVKLHKLRIQGFFVALLSFMTTYSTYAYADINGESIKSNLINNILLPISFVVVGFLLIKE